MMGGFGYGYDGMMGGGWLGGLLVVLFGALIVAGIAVLIVWAVRQSSGPSTNGGIQPPTAPSHDEAVAIARKRLASGEITKEQYADLMEVLR
jgi:uncharacterized membrane protein